MSKKANKNQDISQNKRKPLPIAETMSEDLGFGSKKHQGIGVESPRNMQEDIDYEESFKKHLLKQAEFQKNLEFFKRNIKEKMAYDQRFVQMLQEMSQFLDGNGDSQANLETYKSLLHENQEFLINKTKENQEFLTRNSDNPANLQELLGEELQMNSAKEKNIKKSIQELEETLEKTQKMLEIQENELFLYKEMTNLSIEPLETGEKGLEAYNCRIVSLRNEAKFISFQLFCNEKNKEMQYIPLEIKVDLGVNQELSDEMFFEPEQTDHFMALIYKLVNKM